ncbi:bzip transcription factor [Neofusicoccum parvum]|uniref:Putative bzip transcription factor protein n=1 Tax=Botryosphaeria parva (strain UCR-NP2) TaxID=1287680 RepID=R1GDE5_BOTPV|nr:putative bzip transcription factor protein [Neofusicoccum parvum UCRNP2]GME64725.1 bzip transcription factor [Neofusicoccum parvum]
MKGSTCSYDMRQEHRWQGTLRVNVKKLEQELEEVKSVLPLLATSSQREAATRLAIEIQNNGFSEHSADEIRKILEGPRTTRPGSDDAAPAVGSSSSSSSMGADRKSDVTATAATPESMPAYYTAYEQTVSPGKQSVLGSSASPMPIAAHAMNHPTINFQPNLAHGSHINPVTYTYATFREGKRAARADGASDQKVFGQPENDIHTLINGETDFDNEQPLSMWAPRVANMFFSGAGLAEKLAACEMLKEVMAQVIPHDPTIDFLPWPAVRDFFLHNPEHHVAGVLVNHLSLNWPHEESHLVYCEPNSGSLALSPAFREHISNLNNWTVAPELFEQMPFLMGKLRATGMH